MVCDIPIVLEKIMPMLKRDWCDR